MPELNPFILFRHGTIISQIIYFSTPFDYDTDKILAIEWTMLTFQSFYCHYEMYFFDLTFHILSSLPEPPRFTMKMPSSQFVKPHDSLRLECRVTDTPSLTVNWYKYDNKITASGQYNISFVDSVAVLEFKKPRLEDGGIFTCEALNDAGSDSCSCTVVVKGQK